MAIRFSCPNCGRVIRADDTWIGRKARCPGCQQLIEVPAAEAATVLEPSQSKTATSDTLANQPSTSPTPSVPRPAQPTAPKTVATPESSGPRTVRPASVPPAATNPAGPAAAPARPELAPKPAQTDPTSAPSGAPAIKVPGAGDQPPTRPPVERPKLKPRPQRVAVAPTEAKTAEETPDKPKRDRGRATKQDLDADNRPFYLRPKSMGLLSIALSTVGFLLLWAPFAGLAFSGAGVALGSASAVLSLFRGGLGFGYGLAGVCVGMMGLVPSLVITRGQF